MRILLINLLFLLAALGAQADGLVSSYLRLFPSSLPNQCRAGDLRFDSGANLLNYCGTTNNWNAFSVSSTSPLTTFGDLIYENSTPVPARLAGNTTATKKFLSQTGTGTISAAPTWATILAGDVPTLNQNTTGSAASFTGSLLGDVTGTQGATVVGKINGTSLAGLSTGILKNTTATGVPSIAIAADFPTLNQNTTGTASNVTGTVAIANGGTGQTAKTAAYNALSPNTTKGDIEVFDGTNNVRQAVGADGLVLTADSTQASGINWKTAAGGGGTGLNFVGLSTSFVLSTKDSVDAEGGTVGNWLSYANTAGPQPTTMTGGAPATTCLRTTTAGHIVDGLASFEMSKAASNKQGEGCSLAVNIPPGYRGINAQITIPVLLQSGTIASGDLIVAAYDVTNSALVSVSGCNTFTGSQVLNCNLVIPSTSAQVRIGFHVASTATTAFVLDFDDVVLSPPTNVGVSQIAADDISYTPTFSAGFGTVTNIAFFHKRIGDLDVIHGTATSGTVAASQVTVSLPTGETIDSTKVPAGGGVQGTLVWNGSGLNGTDTVIANGGNTFLQFGQQTATVAHAVTPENGSVWTSNQTFGFTAVVPIKEWATSGTSFRPDTLANSWSGYHDLDCTWTTVSTTFVDPAADATCTFTQRTNSNFGTVTSAGAKTPGIVFTPSKVGSYYVCGNPILGVSASTGAARAKLTDGTTDVATGEWFTGSTGGNRIPICGIYNATSTASVTLKLQILNSSGSSTTSINNLGATTAIEWSIYQISQNMPAPLIVNSVVSSYSGVRVINDAVFNLSGATTASIVRQSGSWISSVSAAGTIMTVNFAAGTFSAAPTCTVTCTSNAFNVFGTYSSDPTTSSVPILCLQSGVASTSNAIHLICMGPK